MFGLTLRTIARESGISTGSLLPGNDVAIVDGLRVAVCAPVRPMPPADARILLAGASNAALERAGERGR